PAAGGEVLAQLQRAADPARVGLAPVRARQQRRDRIEDLAEAPHRVSGPEIAEDLLEALGTPSAVHAPSVEAARYPPGEGLAPRSNDGAAPLTSGRPPRAAPGASRRGC